MSAPGDGGSRIRRGLGADVDEAVVAPVERGRWRLELDSQLAASEALFVETFDADGLTLTGCTPRFSASKGFGLQVRATCPPNAAGARKLRRHTIGHAPSSRSVPIGARIFTSQQAFRDSITRQLLGYVDPD